MTYHAEQRLQITLEDGGYRRNRLHEDAGDGTPLCNIRLRPWGVGGRCSRRAGRARSHV